MELAAADATITFTVNRYLSVTQGKMLTTGAFPDVEVKLLSSGSGRVTMNSNKSFEVSGGTQAGNQLVLELQVLPSRLYDAVGLIIRDPSNANAGSAFWDDCRVGNGSNSHIVTVRDKGKVDAGIPITYELYFLIKTKDPAGALSDYGLIDPKIINT